MSLFEKMTWQEILYQSVNSAESLPEKFLTSKNEIARVIQKYPMKINPYYLSLIHSIDDPVWKQAVPSVEELSQESSPDPLSEEEQSPVSSVIHRYPDRVIFLVSDRCAMYCRHCMRKRKTGVTDAFIPQTLPMEALGSGLSYIRQNTDISEVILSGGDPLMLGDEKLCDLLSMLKAIPHVKVIRIHTRMPCTLPQRITQDLMEKLKKFQPLFVNTQFNHPREITREAADACARLVDNGIPTGCQTVLLKGVNDDSQILAALFKKLIAIRVKPYYLHHPDPIQGALHFRPDIKKGLDIMQKIRGTISGMCVPQYMIDLPGGGGKIPLLPEYVRWLDNNRLEVRNYKNENYYYS
jgi:lysine 2,3-aminomutase